jgi:hypothetical protein
VIVRDMTCWHHPLRMLAAYTGIRKYYSRTKRNANTAADAVGLVGIPRRSGSKLTVSNQPTLAPLLQTRLGSLHLDHYPSSIAGFRVGRTMRSQSTQRHCDSEKVDFSNLKFQIVRLCHGGQQMLRLLVHDTTDPVHCEIFK